MNKEDLKIPEIAAMEKIDRDAKIFAGVVGLLLLILIYFCY